MRMFQAYSPVRREYDHIAKQDIFFLIVDLVANPEEYPIQVRYPMALTTRGGQPGAIMAIRASSFIIIAEVMPAKMLLALPARTISAWIRECC